jgi:hypothetical protein
LGISDRKDEAADMSTCEIQASNSHANADIITKTYIELFI